MESKENGLPEIGRRVGTIDAGLYTLAVALQAILDKYPDAFPEAFTKPAAETVPAKLSEVIDMEAVRQQIDQIREDEQPKETNDVPEAA